MSQPDKDTEQSGERTTPAVEDIGTKIERLQKELELSRMANKFLSKQIEDKTDRLAKLQIATYKCTTSKQYSLIEQESTNMQLGRGVDPPSHFYFPKIGVRRCQCDVCKSLAEGIKRQIESDKQLEGYTDAALFQLTGIGHFEGHSGFNREDAIYLCDFLNKHPEYMHKLQNLDKDRYAQ